MSTAAAAKNAFQTLANTINKTVTAETRTATRLANAGDAEARGVVDAALAEIRQAAQPFVMDSAALRGLQAQIGPRVNVAADAARLVDLKGLHFDGPIGGHPLRTLAGRAQGAAAGL